MLRSFGSLTVPLQVALLPWEKRYDRKVGQRKHTTPNVTNTARTKNGTPNSISASLRNFLGWNLGLAKDSVEERFADWR
jgi:hypothetical protein